MPNWAQGGRREILHNSEDDIGLVSNAIKCHGGNHHNHEVKDPVGTEQKLAAPYLQNKS